MGILPLVPVSERQMREPAEPVLSEMIAQALRQKIIAGELLPKARSQKGN